MLKNSLPHDRERLLREFEGKYGSKIFDELLDLVESKLKASRLSEALESLELYVNLCEALQLLEKIRHGYGVVWTVGLGSALVKPRNTHDLSLLEALSRVGLAIHLPKGEFGLVGDLKKEDHFIIPFIVLQGRIFLSRLEDEINRVIESSHKTVQKAIEEIGGILVES